MVASIKKYIFGEYIAAKMLFKRSAQEQALRIAIATKRSWTYRTVLTGSVF